MNELDEEKRIRLTLQVWHLENNSIPEKQYSLFFNWTEALWDDNM